MKYKHKNLGNYVVRINDSKSNTFYLKPGDEVVIDKPSPRETVILIETFEKEKVKVKKRTKYKKKSMEVDIE